MFTTVTPTNTSFIDTYDRSGQLDALFRSEPANSIAFTEEKSSTTTEKYKDKVTLSPNGLKKSRSDVTLQEDDASATGGADSGDKATANDPLSATQGLTSAEEKMIRQLKDRDRVVKARELAHLAGAGQYARGGPSYTDQQGPDGRIYAVGGEVPIDLGKEKAPELTIQKMRAVQQTALAPAEPSPAERSIAAAASALDNQARQELNTQAQLTQESPNRKNQSVPDNANRQAPSEQTDGAFTRRLSPSVFA